MKSKLLTVHLALIFVQLAFAGLHVFGKVILNHFDPFTLAGLRVSLAIPLFMVLALSVDRVFPNGRDLLRLMGLGFLGVFFNQLLYINGLNFTSATNASILMPGIPVFAWLIAVLSGIEKRSFSGFLGVFTAVGGALIMLDISRFQFADNTATGNLMILMNDLSYAGFLVLAKPMLKRLPPFTVIAWVYLFGGIGIIAVAAPSMIAFPFHTVPPVGWMGLCYIVIFPTILGYCLNAWAIKKSTPSLVATYITSQPLAAALLATMILNEHLGIREVLGFLLIAAGLFMVSVRPWSGQRKSSL